MTPHAPVVDALIKCITTLRALRRDSPRTFFLSLLVASGGLLFGLTVVYGTEERVDDVCILIIIGERQKTAKNSLPPTRRTPPGRRRKQHSHHAPRPKPRGRNWQISRFSARALRRLNFMGVRRARKMLFSQGAAANRRATGDESRGWFEQQQRAKELEWKPMGRTSGVGVIESV